MRPALPGHTGRTGTFGTEVGSADVVVGVAGDRPCDAVPELAFRHAADTGSALRVVESRTPSPLAAAPRAGSRACRSDRSL